VALQSPVINPIGSAPETQSYKYTLIKNNSNNFMKHAKQYFDSHTAVNKLYFTSDNLAFFDEQNALNHAVHLEDQSITTMSREEVDREVEELINDNWEDELEYDPLDEPDAE
jgi:hypothetical protein